MDWRDLLESVILCFSSLIAYIRCNEKKLYLLQLVFRGFTGWEKKCSYHTQVAPQNPTSFEMPFLQASFFWYGGKTLPEIMKKAILRGNWRQKIKGQYII